jgi:alkanesulfonate monooxygenase SsuD/methylene tetrahydromethanopterin reductase-like flavin-dependent oxidoreductase (luciferase family)
MKLGFSLLNNWGIEDVHALVDLAARAETLGLDSVWVHDHVFNLTPEALGQGMAALREDAHACGRDLAQIPVSLAMSIAPATPRRHALGTSAAEIARNAQAFARAGVETLVISATTSDPREARAALEMVGKLVPALSGAAPAI